ncbi:MAG: YbaK/EbsC family protein [Acidimicrobiales bacterium]|jgi:prolyl-tRNA editing enzyme YbaK/EbsC (Cys-tRNA(Pro) deacylase)|nr:YbaK/EbsC family protein [Acidimicrobiales bacterium]HJL98073.1 YbaK/EbsC family protein [Acidimicrobiales bacterium]
MSRITANERFSSAAALLGVEPEIVRFPEDTRTAIQAATALDCELGQIIKSLIFECDGQPVLALTAGDQQVDTEALGLLCGGNIGKADAELVRTATGFSIGGVPPFGHLKQLSCFVDQSIYRYEIAWGAAGTPDTVFALQTAQLERLSGGEITEFVK